MSTEKPLPKFWPKIVRELKRHYWTQQGLAAKIGVPRDRVSRWITNVENATENDRETSSWPSPYQLLQMMKALDVSLEWLCDEDMDDTTTDPYRVPPDAIPLRKQIATIATDPKLKHLIPVIEMQIIRIIAEANLTGGPALDEPATTKGEAIRGFVHGTRRTAAPTEPVPEPEPEPEVKPKQTRKKNSDSRSNGNARKKTGPK